MTAKQYLAGNQSLIDKSGGTFSFGQGPISGAPNWKSLFASLTARHRVETIDVFCVGEGGFDKEVRSHCRTFSNKDMRFRWNGARF